MKVSEKIRKRIIEAGKPFHANDNIADFIESSSELQALQLELQDALHEVLKSMVVDVENDHNTKETAKRQAKMFIHEVFKGRYHQRPRITDFPNAKKLDELYVVGPIDLRSACSHHFVPIIGQLWIGVMPSEKVIGLSKFSRLADWVLSRPHIQEEAVMMLADEIEELIKPIGLGIVMKAKHYCMSWRGVKEADCYMTNSIVRGQLREDKSLKSEFFDILKGQGFTA